MSAPRQKFFHPPAEQTAQATNFVQRPSKMTGSRFLKTVGVGFLNRPTASLNDLRAFCDDRFGRSITSQGLDERIHQDTVTFFQTMLGLAVNLFRQAVRIPGPLLQQFSAGTLVDSPGLSLPESRAQAFPGSGGDASGAALKLHRVVECWTGGFNAIFRTNGITPAHRAPAHRNQVTPTSLSLFDRGDVVRPPRTPIAQQGASFGCRWLPGTGLSPENGQPSDRGTLLRAAGRDRFELLGRVGAEPPRPCRRCCVRAPAEVVNRRRRHAPQAAAKKGRPPGTVTLELRGRTLFIPNVPHQLRPLEQGALLYPLRGQIELRVKLWKSHMKLPCVSGVRQERILVDLYAKLIGFILFQFLVMPLRVKALNLSPLTAFQRFAQTSRTFAQTLRSVTRVPNFLRTFIPKCANLPNEKNAKPASRPVNACLWR